MIDMDDLNGKLKAFGFDTCEVNGHDLEETERVINCLKEMKNGRPKAVGKIHFNLLQSAFHQIRLNSKDSRYNLSSGHSGRNTEHSVFIDAYIHTPVRIIL